MAASGVAKCTFLAVMVGEGVALVVVVVVVGVAPEAGTLATGVDEAGVAAGVVAVPVAVVLVVLAGVGRPAACVGWLVVGWLVG